MVQVFLALTILAVVASVRGHKIFLPTSITTQILAIILPLLTNAILFAITKSSPNRPLRLTGKVSSTSGVRFPLPSCEIAVTILFILDTLLITLASTARSQPTLTCGLESRWQQMFVAKDGARTRAIQDSLRCCGFRSIKDKAWPFPAKGVGVGACVERFGWQTACEGDWTAEARSMLGMMIGVGMGVVVIKVSNILVVRGSLSRFCCYETRTMKKSNPADLCCQIIFLLAVRFRPEWFHGERGQSVFGRLNEGRIMDEEREDDERRRGHRFLDEPERTASGGRIVNEHEEGERLLDGT